LRIALGATRGNVLAMVLQQGLRLAAGGAVVGVVASLAATRVLKSLLFGVHAGNPLVLGGAALGLILVALVACWVPSRRATRVDPMVALRTE
jgi:putative ABC transport system permease protein